MPAGPASAPPRDGLSGFTFEDIYNSLDGPTPARNPNNLLRGNTAPVDKYLDAAQIEEALASAGSAVPPPPPLPPRPIRSPNSLSPSLSPADAQLPSQPSQPSPAAAFGPDATGRWEGASEDSASPQLPPPQPRPRRPQTVVRSGSNSQRHQSVASDFLEMYDSDENSVDSAQSDDCILEMSQLEQIERSYLESPGPAMQLDTPQPDGSTGAQAAAMLLRQRMGGAGPGALPVQRSSPQPQAEGEQDVHYHQVQSALHGHGHAEPGRHQGGNLYQRELPRPPQQQAEQQWHQQQQWQRQQWQEQEQQQQLRRADMRGEDTDSQKQKRPAGHGLRKWMGRKLGTVPPKSVGVV